MAKSLWIKSKAHKLSEKFEVRPVVLLAASLLVAFGFSVYVLYHISKKPQNAEAPVGGEKLSQEQKADLIRSMSGTATDTAGALANDKNRVKPKEPRMSDSETQKLLESLGGKSQ